MYGVLDNEHDKVRESARELTDIHGASTLAGGTPTPRLP
jgi:hypothetical protein